MILTYKEIAKYAAQDCEGKKWKSCAKWPSLGCDDISEDFHETKEQAEAVCRMLERDGLGGEKCHFPLKTWTESI